MLQKKEKRFKIPYLVSVVFPTGLWAFLCALFGAFLILSRIDFEATGTNTIFIIAFSICIFITVLLAFIEYGLLRVFGIKIEKDYLRIINDNIVDNRLLPGLPIGTVKEVFYALIKEPIRSIRVGLKYGVMMISSVLLIEWLASGKTVNLPVIFISGAISYLLVTLFGFSFSEKVIYPAVKQCRSILIEKGERIEESGLINLKKKFNYFLLIPFLLIISILTFIPSINLSVIMFSFIGFIMIVIINWVLSSSIYKAFSEVENFAKELSKKEKGVFSTGSLTKEIVGLSESLNEAANEIYTSRKEIEQRSKKLENSYQEIKKRKDELERFYELTIGRELKMVELKKEIGDLKRRFRGDEKRG